MANAEFHPRFETLPERTVAGLGSTYTYGTANQIPELWHAFAPYIGKLKGQIGDDSFGIVWNEKPGIGFDYLAAVLVSDVKDLPKEFIKLRLPKGKYAVFTHEGDVSSIPLGFNAIWECWLPESEYVSAGTPSYERYTKDFDAKTQRGGIEFWIPVELK